MTPAEAAAYAGAAAEAVGVAIPPAAHAAVVENLVRIAAFAESLAALDIEP